MPVSCSRFKSEMMFFSKVIFDETNCTHGDERCSYYYMNRFVIANPFKARFRAFPRGSDYFFGFFESRRAFVAGLL